MRSKLATLLLLLCATFQAHSYKWSDSGSVTNFYYSPIFNGVRLMHSNQNVFTESTTGCSNNDWIQLDKTTVNEEYYNDMYSLLLALYMSGKPASIRVNGCTDKDYPSIDYISAQ